MRSLLVIVALLAQASVANANSPGQIMERRSEAYIRAHNSGDVAMYGRFRVEHMTPRDDDESWEKQYQLMFKRVGRMEVGDILMKPGQVVLDAMSSTGKFLKVTFRYGGGPHYLIEQVSLDVSDERPQSSLPDLPLNGPMDRDEIRSVLDPYLQDLSDQDLYSGTTLVARNGEIIYESAHGLANKSHDVVNTTDTQFRIGSITKDFTRIAIAQLVEADKLDPQATLSSILKNYPNQDIASRITIDQLLNHSSGMGGMNFREFSELSKKRFRGPKDYLPLFADEPLAFEPGTDKKYSNAGFIVLGVVIEVVSGESYFDYIRGHVFKPADMIESDFYPLDKPAKNTAVGYWKCDPESDDWCNNLHTIEIDGGPSGGSYSTARDLLRFDTALKNYKLLSPAYTYWLFTRKWPKLDQPFSAPKKWPPYSGAGGAEGICAMFASQDGLFVAVLSNYDPPVGEELGLAIFKALRSSRADK